MIWFDKELSIEKMKPLGPGTMGEHLGIEWTAVGENYLKARMPVDHRTKQPYGVLHGGASCALAETVGSVASAMVIDHSKFYCLGIEINANHVKRATEGFVTGVALPLHLGRSIHVWDIKIYDDEEKLICVSRLTVTILKRQ